MNKNKSIESSGNPPDVVTPIISSDSHYSTRNKRESGPPPHHWLRPRDTNAVNSRGFLLPKVIEKSTRAHRNLVIRHESRSVAMSNIIHDKTKFGPSAVRIGLEIDEGFFLDLPTRPRDYSAYIDERTFTTTAEERCVLQIPTLSPPVERGVRRERLKYLKPRRQFEQDFI
eukprot:CAMPEP_0198260000 /NCGR_PEP_ID=MMETSP1447-20131203/9055_1 /TAXON_ID=420782 /ORGANISM="Chaetoceros dichaeta, Strain CCMP1751" /LENGTH=170 /DNA_ID=CAMNT_0043947539 /DNA_START=52 /DNA_END=564 /DNA_ORIENTATION=+